MLVSCSSHLVALFVAAFLLGSSVGLSLAVGIIMLCPGERSQAGNNATRGHLSYESGAAFRAGEIDEDRMLCVDCWEERHPGELWPFRWERPVRCRAHAPGTQGLNRQASNESKSGPFGDVNQQGSKPDWSVPLLLLLDSSSPPPLGGGGGEKTPALAWKAG